jgi:hypothetical protein
MTKYWISVRVVSGSEFTDAVDLGATASDPQKAAE